MTDMTGDELRPSAREQMQNALDHATNVVNRIPEDAWNRPTPCADWSVRDVLNHLTAAHLWAARLLGGETLEQISDSYNGDVLGEDPIAAWDTAQVKSREAWAAAGNAAPLELSFGTTTVDMYAEQMLLDLTVHAWDLARGAKIDEGALVADTVVHVLNYAHEHDIAGKTPFGVQVRTDSDNPQDQLVALLGRRP